MDFLQELNPPQRKAVEHTEGPLLILAGAGSGKTRVLTYRIAHLISENIAAPWNILAITFTNKAAGEMRDRIDAVVGDRASMIWVATFHSTCCRILRRDIDRIGYDRSFTIYDTDDCRQVIKSILREKGLDPKIYKERTILSRISSAKNEMISPEQFRSSAVGREEERQADFYEAYQTKLRSNNALDFDDLLVLTVELFRKAPDVLDEYRERFRYILVDEYQDTNSVQFEFIRLLAEKYRNLCVVGDDDQSIYRFRGANIRNILSFEQVFRGTAVIRLEQNYRSTPEILDAANAVIANNTERKAKKLWTDQGHGKKVRFRLFGSGYEEAEFAVGEIRAAVQTDGGKYSRFAVLYRTNAQSRLFEEKCVAANVPYKIVGGVNFYSRKEIKDILSYLKTIANGSDDLSVLRIINVPRRGIGAATLTHIQEYASEKGLSFYEALTDAENIPGTGRALEKIRKFTTMISRFRAVSADYLSVADLIEQILKETGYLAELEAEQTDEARARIENLEEFISKAQDYADQTEEASLDDFLQQVSLVADIDSVSEDMDSVLLMTMHAAKGLEFDSVYLAGMEENTFPSYMAAGSGNDSEIEEERRLCYVGMTRARRELTLTAASMRTLRGEPQFLKVSRFIREIPPEMLDAGGRTERRGNPYGQYGENGYGGNRYGQYGGERFREEDPYDRRSFGNTDRSYAGYDDRTYSQNGYHDGASSGGFARKTGAGVLKRSAGSTLQEFRVVKADRLDYGIGDQVRHVKFGTGTVTGIQEGPRDFEVTVEFDRVGKKKMFASFAKLKKV